MQISQKYVYVLDSYTCTYTYLTALSEVQLGNCNWGTPNYDIWGVQMGNCNWGVGTIIINREVQPGNCNWETIYYNWEVQLENCNWGTIIINMGVQLGNCNWETIKL